MTSSKLATRRATAPKPPICLSKVIPPLPPLPSPAFHILWYSTPPPSPAIALDENHQLTRDPPGGDHYGYFNPAHGPLKLVSVDLWAPLDATHNYVIVHAEDATGTDHSAHKTFPPAQAPPFSVTISSWDFKSNPSDSILLVIT